jgi:integrase
VRGHVAKKARKGGDVFYVVIDDGRDENGKRRQRWHGPYKTRGEAEDACAKLVVSVGDGSYVAPTRMTVEQYLTDEWLPAVKSTMRQSTYINTASRVRTHLVPHIGRVRLQRLAPAQLNATYAALAADLRPGSVRNVHATVRHALGDAVRWGLIPRNVALLANPPKAQGSAMNTWTAEQTRAFLDFTRGDRQRALWHLLATSGMRRGEVLGLRWTDLDLDAGRVSIDQTLVTSGAPAHVGPPKSARGRRTVALDAGTVAVLRDHRRRQLEERLAVGSAWEESGLVFVKEDGTRTNPDYVSHQFRQLVKAAGLPPVRLHDLRHGWATLALANGVSIKTVADRLGHDPAMTLRTYAHATPGADQAAAETVAAAVFGTPR